MESSLEGVWWAYCERVNLKEKARESKDKRMTVKCGCGALNLGYVPNKGKYYFSNCGHEIGYIPYITDNL